MTNTDSYELDRPVPNLAEGYSSELVGDSLRWRNNLFEHVIKGGPAGGGYSTVDDLLRFATALEGGKLVSAATLDSLWSPKPDLHSPGYGYGFGLQRGGAIVGHNGGFAGISSNLDIFRNDGYVAVVLSNVSRGAFPVTERVREWLAPAR